MITVRSHDDKFVFRTTKQGADALTDNGLADYSPERKEYYLFWDVSSSTVRSLLHNENYPCETQWDISSE